MQQPETRWKPKNFFKRLLPSCVRGRPKSPDLDSYSIQEDTEMPTPVTGSSLTTWPANNLQETITRAIVAKEVEINAEILKDIQEQVEKELESKLPIQSYEKQYDFCVVCSVEDYDDAEKLSDELVGKFGLSGFVVKEMLGTDKFQTFEESARKSTRILFFITEQFNDDRFCSHLIKVLCTPAGGKSYSSKLIPVMGSFGVEVPAPLKILNILSWKSTQFELSVPLVFNEWVKQEREIRTNEKKMLLDNQRLQLMEKLVNEKLGVFV